MFKLLILSGAVMIAPTGQPATYAQHRPVIEHVFQDLEDCERMAGIIQGLSARTIAIAAAEASPFIPLATPTCVPAE